METAFSLQLNPSARSLYGTSSSLPVAASVRHLVLQEDARQSMRNLIRRGTPTSTIHPYPFRFNRTNISSGPNILKDAMTDEAKKQNSSSVGSTTKADEAKKKETEKLAPRNIPPPPEKPDPDDCCGSGCVRCVWDVYYEQLEEYNKRYKSSPDSRSP